MRISDMELFLSFFSVYLHFANCRKDQLPSSETVLKFSNVQNPCHAVKL